MPWLQEGFFSMFSYCHSAWLSYTSRYWLYKWLQRGRNRWSRLNRGNCGRACRQVFRVIISYELSEGFLSRNIRGQKSQDLTTLFPGSLGSSRPKVAYRFRDGVVTELEKDMFWVLYLVLSFPYIQRSANQFS